MHWSVEVCINEATESQEFCDHRIVRQNHESIKELMVILTVNVFQGERGVGVWDGVAEWEGLTLYQTTQVC